MAPQLTVGPILFHWPADKWRDFYFRMADEAPVGTVYVGEVVCSKRTPFYEPVYEEVAERLKRAGKKVVFSTLAQVMIKRDRKIVEGMCSLEDQLIEANDASALWHLSGRPHAIGPFMNVYNEDTLTSLVLNGAEHVCLPPELPATVLAVLAKKANELVVTVEAQVYGRMPLALSARCYHARAHNRVKDNCQFVCEQDPDGMELKTLQGKPFLAVNGIQTMSYACLNLIQEMEEMTNMGITHFRLSPHSHDMVETARLFRAVLDGETAPESVTAKLQESGLNVPFSNGFYHKTEGFSWRAQA
jgi:collagenase-like PrtC family protease